MCVYVLGLATFLGSGTPSAGADPACPNEALRIEQHSTTLPDCRAYEMVSPASKNGADIIGFALRTRAASDGNAVQFTSMVGFGDAHGSGVSFDYMGVRTETAGTSGWTTHAITPGNLEAIPFLDQFATSGVDMSYRGEMSEDLSRGVFGPTFSSLTSGSPQTDTAMNLYLRTDLRSPGAGDYRLLTACPVCSSPLSETASEQPELAGASASFDHVIFETPRNLTADTTSLDPSMTKLYEWSDGVVRLAGILPDGTPASSSEAGAGTLVSSNVAPRTGAYAPNAISRDGSRIYFTQPVANPSSGNLYLRIGNSTPTPSTVQVNVAEPQPNPNPLDDARFQTATPDGSKVFFTTKENLIPADTGNSNLTDLYMYDVNAPAGQHLTLISSPDPGPEFAADVRGLIGVSDDGQYVYFISREQLLSGHPQDSGIPRIFVWHDGEIHEVAATTPTDETPILGASTWREFPKTSRVSPDGTRMLFVSGANDSGAADDLSHDGSGDLCPGGFGCAEVYVYDARTDAAPVCASCHRPDAPAQTNATFLPRSGRGYAGFTSHLNHPLSSDGRFAFFSTGDRLVPEDLNGTTSDVYEYDTAAGALHLLSSGKAASLGSYFLDAGANGRDVFFTTRDQLSGWDADSQVDLYDVRAGGGLPEPVNAPRSCSGDACHGPQANNPAFAPLSSVGFSGAGNLKPHLKKVTPLTKAQKLKKALKKCKSKRKKVQRKKCELSARKSFGRTK